MEVEENNNSNNINKNGEPLVINPLVFICFVRGASSLLFSYYFLKVILFK